MGPGALTSLDVDPARTGDVDRLGSSVSVGFGGVFDALPLGERSESVHDYGRLVDEDVFGAVVRSDKPEALLRIEPFDRACDFGHEKGHGPRP
mmetsp:Transcript_39722/g.93039  ORF Transcript_39722/g.93039 Transcript_39722/m.93039 type:complete len:93 (+) Transcript_39722:174-452(+)